jgi:hypothetical protein
MITKLFEVTPRTLVFQSADWRRAERDLDEFEVPVIGALALVTS